MRGIQEQQSLNYKIPFFHPDICMTCPFLFSLKIEMTLLKIMTFFASLDGFTFNSLPVKNGLIIFFGLPNWFFGIIIAVLNRFF